MSQAIIPCYHRYDLCFVRGNGAYLISDQGKEYLDFAAGVAVNSLGANHPLLRAAVGAQIEQIWHCSNLYQIQPQVDLAEKLVAASFADKVLFCNSGLEANEAMVKLARRYHYLQGNENKFKILTLKGGFHGRSLAMLAATGKTAYLEGMGPVVEGFVQIARDNLALLTAAITDDVAAIMLEPILGEDGIYPLSACYLQEIRKLADQHNILLLLDEIQTGVGRTGDLWAYQQAEIMPDAMTLAKGLGGGFPIGALLANAKTADVLNAGMHGTTFGGNYLAMTAGKTVLDIVNQPEFLTQVTKIGALLQERLQQLKYEFPEHIHEIRGRGLMLGMQLQEPYKNSDLIAELHLQQMLVVPAANNVIRFLPPLIIDENHIALAYQKLTLAFQKVQPCED